MKNKEVSGIVFPIGSIVCYAADLSIVAKKEALIAMGWLICDGQSYANTDYPLLAEAIKTVNGGDAERFNVPNLTSRFLRGTSGEEAARDPQANSREEAAPHGATGNNTGSLEKSATALPTSNFKLSNAGLHTHKIKHLGGESIKFWSGGDHTATKDELSANTSTNGVHAHSISGFDEKCVPINMAVYYIIKAADIAVNGTTPVGGMVAFGGPAFPEINGWLKCNGKSLDVQNYTDLKNTIGTNYGGTDAAFNVPDLRGYFVRGTNYRTKRDPNAGNREPLMPGGNINDNVGSLQLFATARPAGIKVDNAGAHSHSLSSVPKDKQHLGGWVSGAASTHAYKWTDDETSAANSGEHTHTVIGGDQETRPENIYADYFIATNSLLTSAPPLGSIMAFGGDPENPVIRTMLLNAGWHLCDGSKLEISKYTVLYDLIGDLYASGPTKSPYTEPNPTTYLFSLPDLRGLFIQGAGIIKIGTFLEKSITGNPLLQIMTTGDGGHYHSMPDVPSATVGLNDIHWISENDAALNNADPSITTEDGIHTHEIASGGDSETRPTNVYVNFIIRIQ